MSTRCQVCLHPQRDAIDEALVAGATQVALAEQYGVSKYVVHRHNRTHLPEKLSRAHEAAAVATSDNLLAKLVDLEATAKRIAVVAETAGQSRTVLLAVRELTRQIELLAKLRGVLSEAATINLTISPEWVQVRAVVLGALSPFPDARVAVAASLAAMEDPET